MNLWHGLCYEPVWTSVCLLQAGIVLKRLNITEPVISIQSSLSLYYAVFEENYVFPKQGSYFGTTITVEVNQGTC